MQIRFIFLPICACLPFLSGCASLSPEGSFSDVAASIEERTGRQIYWARQGDGSVGVATATADILSRALTPSGAVHIALLNNRSLRAEYAKLGIAQADLVQAALPPNPVAAGTITFADSGATNLVFGGALQVIEMLRIPLKKRVAESQLEQAKIEVASSVLRVVAATQIAFIRYQAAEHSLTHLNGTLKTTRAAVTAAEGLREAGNITALDFETQNAELISQELSLTRAKTQAVSAREVLNVLMGLGQNHTGWEVQHRLPDVPKREIGINNAEARAIRANLELASARQTLVTLAQKYRLTKAKSLAPEGAAGGEWQQDSGDEEAGPVFEATLPLFDWGQARKAKAKMEIARARDVERALVVKVAARARSATQTLRAARKSALYHRAMALPQAERLMRESQRQYNAMQLNVFQLIRAKQTQLQATQRHTEALAAYWIARASFLQLMKGTLPIESETLTSSAPDGAVAEAN
jgi:outer membrane protein TolC